MILQIALVATGSALLLATGWFAGVAYERAQKPRVGPRHTPAPLGAQSGAQPTLATEVRVAPARYRARARTPYGSIDLDD